MIDYEQLLEGFYTTLLRPGDVVVDVGAHTGRHTLPMIRAVAPGGQVFAFEPLPMARAQLERSIADRGPGVTVFPYALADREGTDEFVVALDLPAYSGLKTRIYDAPTRLERISVEVRTLDGVLAGQRSVRYVKIDAEGGELGILRGATSMLARQRPVVSFEFGANSLASYGISVRDMAEFWSGKAYVLHDILGNPLDAGEFERSAVTQNVWDYLATPAEIADAVTANWRSTGIR